MKTSRRKGEKNFKFSLACWCRRPTGGLLAWLARLSSLVSSRFFSFRFVFQFQVELKKWPPVWSAARELARAAKPAKGSNRGRLIRRQDGGEREGEKKKFSSSLSLSPSNFRPQFVARRDTLATTSGKLDASGRLADSCQRAPTMGAGGPRDRRFVGRPERATGCPTLGAALLLAPLEGNSRLVEWQ